jgi:hypothetical protein
MAIIIQRTGGSGQSAGYNKTFPEPLRVSVYDNATIPPTPVSSGTVVFQSMGNSGTDPFVTFSGNSSQGAEVVNGVASSVRPVSNAIAGSASVRCWGFGTEVFFSLKIKAPSGASAPSSIGSISGDNQIILQGAGPSLPITVTVLDQYDAPVNNATVNWALPSSGPGGTFNDVVLLAADGVTPLAGTTATSTSNSSGVATAPTFTANSQLGTWQVTATLAADTSVNTTLSMQTVPASGTEVCTAALVPTSSVTAASAGSTQIWSNPERWLNSLASTCFYDTPGQYSNLLVASGFAAGFASIPDTAEITRLTFSQQIRFQISGASMRVWFENTAFGTPRITSIRQLNQAVSSSFTVHTYNWTVFTTPNLGSKLYGANIKAAGFRIVQDLFNVQAVNFAQGDARFLTVTACYIQAAEAPAAGSGQFCEV